MRQMAVGSTSPISDLAIGATGNHREPPQPQRRIPPPPPPPPQWLQGLNQPQQQSKDSFFDRSVRSLPPAAAAAVEGSRLVASSMFIRSAATKNHKTHFG